MGATSKVLSPQVRAWVEARKRHHLSHAQVQMARELGLDPRKLSSDTVRQFWHRTAGREDTAASCGGAG